MDGPCGSVDRGPAIDPIPARRASQTNQTAAGPGLPMWSCSLAGARSSSIRSVPGRQRTGRVLRDNSAAHGRALWFAPGSGRRVASIRLSSRMMTSCTCSGRAATPTSTSRAISAASYAVVTPERGAQPARPHASARFPATERSPQRCRRARQPASTVRSGSVGDGPALCTIDQIDSISFSSSSCSAWSGQYAPQTIVNFGRFFGTAARTARSMIHLQLGDGHWHDTWVDRVTARRIAYDLLVIVGEQADAVLQKARD